MKKAGSVFCAVLVASSLAFTGCANNQPDSPPDMDEDITGEITVSCYDSMVYKGFLEEAAKAFEAKYPGTTVHVEAFGQMPEIKTAEDGNMAMVRITENDNDTARDDYISKVSTELMSGGGADVLAMDVLPYYKYAENGQLEDLNRYMEADSGFSIADYRENVIRALAYQGGQYLLPLDYSFQYFAYDSTLLGPQEQQALQASDAFTYKDLIDIAKTPFQTLKNKMFGFYAGVNQKPNLFTELLDEAYDSYIDIAEKRVNLDDGRFAQLLEDAKAYEEAGYINPARNPEQQMSTSTFMQDQSERYFYKPKDSFNLLSHFNRIAGVRGNIVMSTGIGTGNEADDEIAGIAANADGEASFTYQQAYGMNINSANKRTAWEFIKFLLSEDMQISPQLSMLGSPVHNDARKAKAEMLVTGEFRPQMPAGARVPDRATGGEMAGGDAPDANIADSNSAPDNPAGPEAPEAPTSSEKHAEVLANYLTQSEAFANMLSRYIIRDTKIDAMITAEVKNFFNGTKSAEDVAKALQSKVELYLNE